MLTHIILATLLISLISLVGIIVSHKKIKKFLHYFISFAAGTLIAVAFFDLIPSALENMGGEHVEGGLYFVVIGIVLFFLVERFIHWHHCDKEQCKERPEGVLILLGDFVHNFIDGLLIAGAFIFDFSTGVVTTIMVAIHEIPQEFGDFAVLIHSGFSKQKALVWNFLSALSAVIGGIVGFFLFDAIQGVAHFAILIAAGGFVYVALSDIMPNLHKHGKNKAIIFNETVIFVVTLIVLYFVLGFFHSH